MSQFFGVTVPFINLRRPTGRKLRRRPVAPDTLSARRYQQPLWQHDRVRQNSRSLVFCEAEVANASGQVVATASGTFKVSRKASDV